MPGFVAVPRFARAVIAAEGRKIQTPKNDGQLTLEIAMNESEHGARFVAWAGDLERLNPGALPGLPRLHHIPNGGKRDALTARKMQREGVLPGVSDYFLPVPVGGFYGLYLELKKLGGRPSIEQRTWISESTDLGYRAAIVTGWRQAAVLTLKYYADGLPPEVQSMGEDYADQAVKALDLHAAGL